MGRRFLAVACFLIFPAAGCAPVVLVEGEPAPLECLPAGAVRPTLAPQGLASCPTTCLEMGTACGSVDLGCGDVEVCGCGNPDYSECVAGNCQCIAAPEPEACALCPGRVPRYCGEGSPKTQAGCERLDATVGNRRLWCCAE